MMRTATTPVRTTGVIVFMRCRTLLKGDRPVLRSMRDGFPTHIYRVMKNSSTTARGLLHSMSRNILAIRTTISRIAVSLMNGYHPPSGEYHRYQTLRRSFGTRGTNERGRQFMKLTVPWGVIALSIGLSIAALTSGCTSAGGSVTRCKFVLPVIGAEIDFALSVPAVGVLSLPPTSQPSSENEGQLSDSSPSLSDTQTPL